MLKQALKNKVPIVTLQFDREAINEMIKEFPQEFKNYVESRNIWALPWTMQAHLQELRGGAWGRPAIPSTVQQKWMYEKALGVFKSSTAM